MRSICSSVLSFHSNWIPRYELTRAPTFPFPRGLARALASPVFTVSRGGIKVSRMWKKERKKEIISSSHASSRHCIAAWCSFAISSGLRVSLEKQFSAWIIKRERKQDDISWHFCGIAWWNFWGREAWYILHFLYERVSCGAYYDLQSTWLDKSFVI